MLKPSLNLQNLPYTIRGVKMPNLSKLRTTKKYIKRKIVADYNSKSNNANLENLKLFNVDWLELSCKRNMNYKPVENTAIENKYNPETFIEDLEKNLFLFRIVENTKLKSKQFKDVFDVYHIDYEDEAFATLSTNAHVSFINKDVTIIKVHNRWLYSKNYVHYLECMMNELNLKLRRIKRLDICLDFEKMDNGYTPQSFLRSIATLEFNKKGVRNAEPTIAKNENSDTDDFRSKWYGKNVKCVSWGSRSSSLYSIFYNKSLELKQRKSKPYIVEMWEQFGFNTENDIYRLEFSFKPTKKGILDAETGQIFDFTNFDILKENNPINLFKAIHDKRFLFAKNEGRKRFSRCEKVKTFDWQAEADRFLLMEVSEKEESSNHTKYFINKLFKRIQSFTYKDSQELGQLELYLSEILFKHHLTSWFKRKHPNYELKEIVLEWGQLKIHF